MQQASFVHSVRWLTLMTALGLQVSASLAGHPRKTLASGAEYAAHGALTKLVLGNGLIEKMTRECPGAVLEVSMSNTTSGWLSIFTLRGNIYHSEGVVLKRARGSVLLFVVILTVSAQSPKTVAERTQEIGYWIDPSTDLMWAGKDNGRDLTWQKAMKYCRDLRLAGHADWRLAALAEMQGIFNKKESAAGMGGEGKTTHIT